MCKTAEIWRDSCEGLCKICSIVRERDRVGQWKCRCGKIHLCRESRCDYFMPASTVVCESPRPVFSFKVNRFYEQILKDLGYKNHV